MTRDRLVDAYAHKLVTRELGKLVKRGVLTATVENGEVFFSKVRPDTEPGLGNSPSGESALEVPPVVWREDEKARRALVEAGGSVLANVRKGKDSALVSWARETGRFVYIGARSPRRPDLVGPFLWANPYRAISEVERDHVCNLFARHLATSPVLRDHLHELCGKVLACWCAPRRCHGEELLKALEEVPR